MATTLWRLLFPHSYIGSPGYRLVYNVCVTGVEMRESQGGPNVATGGTASADSSEGGSATPANGFLPYSGDRRWQNDSYSAGGWNDAVDRYPHWLAYEFPDPVEIEEISITGVAGSWSGIRRARGPVKIVLQYSDDNGTNWTTKYSWVSTTPWATDGSDVRVFNSANAVNKILQNHSLYVLSAVNFPAEELRATAYQVTTTIRRMSQELRATKMHVVSLVRGRTYNPKLRAWAFTLDGHDFYVLRLGDDKTLVYDLLTDQWSQYTSGELPFWRPNTGMNWYSAGSIPQTHGSNVICLDDTYGHIWVLNPEQGYDDDASDPDGEAQRFPRVATGQVLTRKRQFMPVFEVYLTASAGRPVISGDEVTLEYSDDLGATYVDAGAIAVIEGDYTQQFAWRSLGQIAQPGRLFRIVDDGAFARIDGLDL